MGRIVGMVLAGGLAMAAVGCATDMQKEEMMKKK